MTGRRRHRRRQRHPVSSAVALLMSCRGVKQCDMYWAVPCHSSGWEWHQQQQQQQQHLLGNVHVEWGAHHHEHHGASSNVRVWQLLDALHTIVRPVLVPVELCLVPVLPQRVILKHSVHTKEMEKLTNYKATFSCKIVGIVCRYSVKIDSHSAITVSTLHFVLPMF